MKKQYSITALLGVRQQDVAMLLRVHPSQWSMYESGKRDLPLAAKQLLAELLTHQQSPETTASKLPHHAQQQKQLQQQLERLLRENEYQQLLVARKINSVEKKYSSQLRVLQLVDFLSNHPTQKGKLEMRLLKTIEKKAVVTIEAEGLAVLVKYQIKQESLELEKLLLQSKLRKIKSDLEFINNQKK